MFIKGIKNFKNEAVKAFVDTINESALPDKLLTSGDNFKEMLQNELNKPEYAKAFASEADKNKAIELFTGVLNHSASMQKLAKNFSEKMASSDFKATDKDLEDIENTFKQNQYSSHFDDAQKELANIMALIDTRKLPDDNILNTLKQANNGLSFFNCYIEGNMMVVETTRIFEEYDKHKNIVRETEDLNHNALYNYEELTQEEVDKGYVNYEGYDNATLIFAYNSKVDYQKRQLKNIGDNFEQNFFKEDYEKLDQELKFINKLERYADKKDGIQKRFTNFYELQDNLKYSQSITDERSPFYVPETLVDVQKARDNVFAYKMPRIDATKKKALETYFLKLNNTLQQYGYKDRVTTLPDKQKREELFNFMKKSAEQGVKDLKNRGISRNAFDDPPAFISELEARGKDIFESEIYTCGHALQEAREAEIHLQRMETVLDKRVNIVNSNINAVTSHEKFNALLQDTEPIYAENIYNTGCHMAGLARQLTEKERRLHIDSPSFRKLKKAMNRLKAAEDYLDDLANDRVTDHYAYHLSKDSIGTQKDFVKAIQDAHDAAEAYLKGKNEQTRKNPSEMRKNRLETANEILKVTNAFLKQHKTLEESDKKMKAIKDDVSIRGSYDKFKDASKCDYIKREKPVIPSIKSREPVAEKKVEKTVAVNNEVQNQKDGFSASF